MAAIDDSLCKHSVGSVKIYVDRSKASNIALLFYLTDAPFIWEKCFPRL